MSGKDLGFGGKLANITPDVEEPTRIPDARIDQVGERHGFVALEPIQKLTRRKPSEPSARQSRHSTDS